MEENMYNIEQLWKDWRIVKLLGEGSFGKVYEIERNNYGIEEHSALKVITIPQSTAEVRSLKNEGMDEQSVTSFYLGLVKDFAQEIDIMSKLKGNPGIVAYDDYAIVEHDKDFGWDIVIRMELLTPLAEYKKTREFGEEEVVNLAIELCDALSLCQSKNIIHRDIKIDNIFVSDSGRYKLGDFGVARTIEKTSGGLSKKGTYSYMAPEVYKGEAYGHKADIYSLGMVLYKLLNYNREPFLPLPPETIKYTDKNNSLVRRMKGERFDPPANADSSLAQVIMKACAYLPEDRFADSAEMKSELDRVLMMRIQTNNTPIIKKNDEVFHEPKQASVGKTKGSILPSQISPSEVKGLDKSANSSEDYSQEPSLYSDVDEDERTLSAFSDSSKETVSHFSTEEKPTIESSIQTKGFENNSGEKKDYSDELNNPIKYKTKDVKKKKRLIIGALLIATVVTSFFVIILIIVPETKYQKAIVLMSDGKYEDAVTEFNQLNSYKNSKSFSTECSYLLAKEYYDKDKYNSAKDLFSELGDYKDAKALVIDCDYNIAMDYYYSGGEANYELAKQGFSDLGNYKDSQTMVLECDYQRAKELMVSDVSFEIVSAVSIFEDLGDYNDSKKLLKEAKLNYCVIFNNNTDETTYKYLKELKGSGNDTAKEMYKELYTWKVTNVVWNSNENDSTKNLKSISKYKSVYIHFRISGGTPNETTRLSVKWTHPNGESKEEKFDYDSSDGSETWFGWKKSIYQDPDYGMSGTLYLSIFDGKGNELYSGSIEITS